MKLEMKKINVCAYLPGNATSGGQNSWLIKDSSGALVDVNITGAALHSYNEGQRVGNNFPTIDNFLARRGLNG